MSFLLNCPRCSAKPSLEESRDNYNVYTVICYPCTKNNYLMGLGTGVDPAICDWNTEVLRYLVKEGEYGLVIELRTALENYPAWQRHIESGNFCPGD